MTNNSLFALANKFEIKTATKNDQFLYHLKTDNFKGKIIYPLAELETIYPAIFKEQSKKYKGREDQIETKVPTLDCKWKNIVNFSTINPAKIFQLEELLGFPAGEDCDILKFNIKDFKNFSMCSFNENLSFKNPKAYSKITSTSYKESQFISPETCKYFAECKSKNEPPLIFGGVEHILVQGNIDVGLAEVIKFKSVVKK